MQAEIFMTNEQVIKIEGQEVIYLYDQMKDNHPFIQVVDIDGAATSLNKNYIISVFET